MKRIALTCLSLVLTASVPLGTLAQIGSDQILLEAECVDRTEPIINLIKNWDFEETPLIGDLPFSWTASAGKPFPTTQMQMGPLTDPATGNLLPNHYVEYDDGESMSQTPNADTRSNATFYKISFCADVREGQIVVLVGGTVRHRFPDTPGTSADRTESLPFRADYSHAQAAINNTVEIRFEGVFGASNPKAFIDNVSLEPSASGSDDDNTPTPTPIPATPTPGEARDTPTPEPTPRAGTPTPTPTPQLTAQSVQVVANPPMLLVSPDDFVDPNGPRKQSLLRIQVIGSNGRPIDIAAIDPNARVNIRIDDDGETRDVGVIRSFELGGTEDQTINNRDEDFSDTIVGNNLLAFVPARAYDGVVRLVVDVEFESITEGRKTQKTIRGVTPIVLRTDPKASLIDPSGQFNPVRNARVGRQPGDRGFRPDQRTNLFFRERTEN